jgi:hypothetical protein
LHLLVLGGVEHEINAIDSLYQIAENGGHIVRELLLNGMPDESITVMCFNNSTGNRAR